MAEFELNDIKQEILLIYISILMILSNKSSVV